MDELVETLNWYRSLEPKFKLLFGLPFVVAAAGLLGSWLEDQRRSGRGDTTR
jgi:hypothetical protein